MSMLRTALEENERLKERLHVLEAALRQIRNEAKDCDVLIYEIARDALEPPR